MNPPAVTPGDGASATLLVVVLLGSVTAGLFFASPLRRRLVRGSFASTGLPTRMTEASGVQSFERMATFIYDRLQRLTASWPVRRTRVPLPPMLGGDIFEDEQRSASRRARPDAATAVPAPMVEAMGEEQSPWSTSPIAADERYLPSR